MQGFDKMMMTFFGKFLPPGVSMEDIQINAAVFARNAAEKFREVDELKAQIGVVETRLAVLASHVGVVFEPDDQHERNLAALEGKPVTEGGPVVSEEQPAKTEG